jgi:hypothetical protein
MEDQQCSNQTVQEQQANLAGMHAEQNYAGYQDNGVCPHCDACRHCGRGPVQIPYNPYPYPNTVPGYLGPIFGPVSAF